MSRYIPMPAYPDCMPVDISFVFESEFEQYDGDVKSLLNEMLGELQKNDESLNINVTLDEIETKIASVKRKLKKI